MPMPLSIIEPIKRVVHDNVWLSNLNHTHLTWRQRAKKRSPRSRGIVDDPSVPDEIRGVRVAADDPAVVEKPLPRIRAHLPLIASPKIHQKNPKKKGCKSTTRSRSKSVRRSGRIRETEQLDNLLLAADLVSLSFLLSDVVVTFNW